MQTPVLARTRSDPPRGSGRTRGIRSGHLLGPDVPSYTALAAAASPSSASVSAALACCFSRQSSTCFSRLSVASSSRHTFLTSASSAFVSFRFGLGEDVEQRQLLLVRAVAHLPGRQLPPCQRLGCPRLCLSQSPRLRSLSSVRISTALGRACSAVHGSTANHVTRLGIAQRRWSSKRWRVDTGYLISRRGRPARRSSWPHRAGSREGGM